MIVELLYDGRAKQTELARVPCVGERVVLYEDNKATDLFEVTAVATYVGVSGGAEFGVLLDRV